MNKLFDGLGDFAFHSARASRRHLLVSIYVLIVETLACLGFGVAHNSPLSLSGWGVLIGVIWLGSFSLAWVVNHNPPSWLQGRKQIMPLTLWAIGCILVTAYFLNRFRLGVMMFCFPILLMASFRLRKGQMLTLCGCTVLGYLAVVVWVSVQRPMFTAVSMEVLQWIIFTAITASLAVSGGFVRRTRRRLTETNQQLSAAAERAYDSMIHDELTGLYNRRQIMEVLGHQQRLADHGGYQFVLCYVDLDHFKTVNDRFGHTVGDAVLSGAAALFSEELREADYCGRIGGEEFLFVLTQTGLENAVNVVDRVRCRFAETGFDTSGGEVNVTFSAGVTASRAGEPMDAILARADGALYQAKAGGRNRILTS